MKELKTIADSSKQLLNMIKSIRPKIDEKLAEASTHDVKDSGKEKGEDGTHKGLLSKFSAPGKYRRNMKHLRENRKLLDLIYCEVESIVKTFEKQKDTAEAEQFDQEAAYQEVWAFYFLYSSTRGSGVTIGNGLAEFSSLSSC